MRLIQTDHSEQALVLDDKTKLILSEAITFFYNFKVGSVELRTKALDFLNKLTSPSCKDQPVLFQKSCKLTLCDSCSGSGTEKEIPDDRNKEPEFYPCSTCRGKGRLYIETIIKSYIPTPELLKKMIR